MRSLGDGVAVADLRVVGQASGRRRFVEQGVAGVAVEQFERPIVDSGSPPLKSRSSRPPVSRLPKQDGADQPVVAQDQLLVNALGRVEMADDLAIGPLRADVAHRGQVDAHDLERGGQPRAGVGRVGLAAGQHVGQDARLLVDRIDQAVEPAAMLGAFADGEDRRVAGAQLIVDDDGRARPASRPPSPPRRWAECRS